MEEIRLTSTQAYLSGALIGAGIGFLLGLVPLITGIVNKKVKLGLIGIAVATLGGAVLGVIISIPAMAIFTWLILRDRVVPSDETAVETSGDEEKPAS